MAPPWTTFTSPWIGGIMAVSIAAAMVLFRRRAA